MEISDLFINLSLVILTSVLTYFLGIRKFNQEIKISRQIDIYESLMVYIRDFPATMDDPSDEKLNQQAKEFNDILTRIYLNSPDHVVRDVKSSMAKIRKGAKIIIVYDIMLLLRQEIIPRTTLKSTDFEFLSFKR